MTDLQVSPKVLHARTAVSVAFLMNGLMLGLVRSPAPPPCATHSGCRPRSSGLLLLCMSGGSISGLPLSGPIVHALRRRPGGARAARCVGRSVSTGHRRRAARRVGVLAAPGLVLIGLGHRRSGTSR